MSKLDDFKVEVRKCLVVAAAKYGFNELWVDAIGIRFDLRGTTSAKACKRGIVHFFRFNPEAVEKYYDQMVSDTLPHEVAHMVGWLCPQLGIKVHCRRWRAVCIALGGSGERCHRYQLTPARSKKIHYYMVGGKVIYLGPVQHKKIQTGQARYWCKETGINIAAEHYCKTIVKGSKS